MDNKVKAIFTTINEQQIQVSYLQKFRGQWECFRSYNLNPQACDMAEEVSYAETAYSNVEIIAE